MSLRRPWVGIQGGASKGLRKPPPAWLRAFGREFLGQIGGTLFLLGTGPEEEAFQPLLRSLSPAQRRRCVNACGSCDAASLASLAASLDALVSVDTFTLHLAAAAMTPVLGLYPGPASPHETGPWGQGHLVLWADAGGGPCECEEGCTSATACWDRLHPELCVGALGLLIAKGEMTALKGRRVRAFETHLDPEGFRLKAVDGDRERDRPQESLAQMARAWAVGGPRPEPGLGGLEAGFADLGLRLRRGFSAADLSLKREPADWFRAQALAAASEDGVWDRGALDDIAAGCDYFASAAAFSVRAS